MSKVPEEVDYPRNDCKSKFNQIFKNNHSKGSKIPFSTLDYDKSCEFKKKGWSVEMDLTRKHRARALYFLFLREYATE